MSILLLDTHLLIWAASRPDRLSAAARALIEAPQNRLVFSAVSIWEVAIKQGLGRADFTLDAQVLLRALRANDYTELTIGGAHCASCAHLPPIHKDPFDRLLVAQATLEGMTLLTTDPVVARYPGPVRAV